MDICTCKLHDCTYERSYKFLVDLQYVIFHYGQYLHVCVFFQDFFDDEDSAFRAVRKGKAWGALSFSSNYSLSLLERINEGQAAGEWVLDDSCVSIWLDESSNYFYQ